MSEMDEKLNTLLSDPGKDGPDHAAWLSSLRNYGRCREDHTGAATPPADPEDQTGGGTVGFWRIGGLDPASLGKLLPLAQEYGRKEQRLHASC